MSTGDLLSLNISISPQPTPTSGTWFQHLQGCFGNEERQSKGESHVPGSDPIAHYIQQVKYLKTRKKEKKKSIFRTATSFDVCGLKQHSSAVARHSPGPPQWRRPRGLHQRSSGQEVARSAHPHNPREATVRGDLTQPPWGWRARRNLRHPPTEETDFILYQRSPGNSEIIPRTQGESQPVKPSKSTLSSTHLGPLSEPGALHMRIVGRQDGVGHGSHLRVIAAEGRDGQAQSI